MKAAILAAAGALALAATPAAAAYIYTPGPDYERTREGNSGNLIFVRDEPVREQFFFGASMFGTEPIQLNGIAFRWDAAVYNHKPQGTFEMGPDFAIRFDTLGGARSRTFANNLTAPVTVMSGRHSIPWVISAPNDVHKTDWGVVLNFDTPYVYDPSKGALVMDIFIPKQVVYGYFDFVAGNPNLRRLLDQSEDGTAITGFAETLGPVARFDVSTPAVVPEPTSWALMILGFGATGALLRGARRAATA